MVVNIDPDEVQKFEDMAEHWWDKEGPCKPLHELNPLRLAFVQSCCTLNQHSILDIGCGGGILTETLSHFSPHVYGIDPSEKGIKTAVGHASTLKHPPHYEVTTAESFAKDHAQQFEVITCMEMLEHVPDPLSVIGAAATLLKPGGHLFFSTINRTPKAFVYAIIGAEYFLKMLPKGTHHYDRFIRPSELAEWARSFGLVVKHLKGISYNPMTSHYALCESVSVNYIMHLEKEQE